MNSFTKVALAITTIGLIAVLVTNGANTAKVVSAAGSAFSGSLSAAEKG
jgi:hypothetical protein